MEIQSVVGGALRRLVRSWRSLAHAVGLLVFLCIGFAAVCQSPAYTAEQNSDVVTPEPEVNRPQEPPVTAPTPALSDGFDISAPELVVTSEDGILVSPGLDNSGSSKTVDERNDVSFDQAYVNSILSIVVALLFITAFCIMYFFRRATGEFSRHYLVLIVMLTTVFLLVLGYDEQQVAPAFGLLGTILGYIFGRASGSSSANGSSGGGTDGPPGGGGQPPSGQQGTVAGGQQGTVAGGQQGTVAGGQQGTVAGDQQGTAKNMQLPSESQDPLDKRETE
jgi:hypothetical protein